MARVIVPSRCYSPHQACSHNIRVAKRLLLSGILKNVRIIHLVNVVIIWSIKENLNLFSIPEFRKTCSYNTCTLPNLTWLKNLAGSDLWEGCLPKTQFFIFLQHPQKIKHKITNFNPTCVWRGGIILITLFDIVFHFKTGTYAVLKLLDVF